MLPSERKHYLIAAKYNLIEQIKARILTKVISQNITKFIKEELICHYNGCEILIINRDPKNKSLISNLIRKFKIKKKIIFIYYSQTNRLIKRGHQLIKKILAKLTDRETRH